MTSGQGKAAQPAAAKKAGAKVAQPVAAKKAGAKVAQAVAAKELRDDDIRVMFDELDLADEQELERIDAALDAVGRAGSREAAVAELARATVSLNAFYARTVAIPPPALAAPPPQIFYSQFSHSGIPYVVYTDPSLAVTRRQRAEKAERGLGERLEKYLKTANDLAGTYGPDQFQVSVGFPLLFSITLTWNKKKDSDVV